MATPTLDSYQSQLQMASGQALGGPAAVEVGDEEVFIDTNTESNSPLVAIAVLAGALDAVNGSTTPGSPLATIYADPYGNSQIPQSALSLTGQCTTVAGSPNVAYSSGTALSQYLVGQTITINGVQYTVESWSSANGVTSIVLEQDAQSSGTFTWTATIPAIPLTPDGQGNFQFWALRGYYTLQVYGSQIPTPYFQCVTLGAAALQ